MALDLRLDAKLTQSLVMTPRLQQAIKLLQYNHVEMVQHVEEALLENPTLEALPDSPAGEREVEIERTLHDDAARAEQETVEQQNGQQGDLDWERLLAQLGDRPSTAGMTGGTIQEDLPPIEANLTYGESLADHLLWQLRMIPMTEDEERVATAVIHNLDHRGYLAATIEEIAESVGVEAEVVEDVLAIVRDLDPVGCGARDLSECLVIQARHHFPEDDNFPRILVGHLHNLERRNYQAIAKDLGLELEDVVEYHRMIQEFEPTPGRRFSGEEARYITPDLYVEKRDGSWEITLNEDGMPDLRVSSYYQKVLRSASKKDREYLIDKLRGAQFLIKSIHKRRRTIRRVMEAILRFQADFFEHGPDRLRPLVLQDVADAVNVHMSTVSRVTTNKFVHTPHGIFELKSFFSASVRQQSGEDVASRAIQARIRDIVRNENAKKPLSDQAIANHLKQEGIDIARRTVAKYREELGILPSSKRKQVF